MVDTKLRQHLAVLAIANCSICHGEGFRYNNPNAKPDCLAACQITVGWRTRCACSSSLSGIRCRIVVFSFQISLILLSTFGQLWLWPGMNQITFASRKASLRSTDLQWRALSLSPLPKQPKPIFGRSQSLFAGETFHSTLCPIKFLSVQWGEARAQELQLQSPNHTRGILISPLSSCQRHISLITKHCIVYKRKSCGVGRALANI